MVYGALVALFALLIQALLRLPVHPYDPIYIALGAALLAGVVKELADWYTNWKTPGTRQVSFMDVVATTLGGVAIATAILIVR
jgi:hypothetical protein